MSDPTEVIGLARPDFNEAGWADQLNENFTKIDAAVGRSIFFVSFRGPWIVNTLYRVNDIAIDIPSGSTVWKCLVENTSPGSGTFGDHRTANPTYWEEQTTAASSAASAQSSAEIASLGATNAATFASDALGQANDALTHATNAQGFASASAVSAAASAASALASAASAAGLNAVRAFEQDVITTMPVTAVTNTDFVLSLNGAYVLEIYHRTKVAYTGGTVNLTIGTTVGGTNIVAAVNIASKGYRRLVIVDASADLLSPFAGGPIHIRLSQSAPTTVGDGVLLVKLLLPV